MGYTTGEALILTAIQALTNFDSINTAREDFSLPWSGKDDHYAILMPGGFDIAWMAPTSYTADYTTIVQIWRRFDTDTTTAASLGDYMNQVIAGLMAKKHLGGTTITLWSVASGDAPEEIWQKPRKRGGAETLVALKQNLYIKWTEQSTVTFT